MEELAFKGRSTAAGLKGAAMNLEEEGWRIAEG